MASSQLFLTRNSITHVLSIGANPSAKVDGVTYHRLSLSDSVSSSISKIADAACEIIDGAIASKKGTGNILVHCSAGISRSSMAVDEAEGKAAPGQIIHVRPQISPNDGFLRQLKEMELELYGSNSLEVEFPKQEKDRLALFEEPKAQPNKELNPPSYCSHTSKFRKFIQGTQREPACKKIGKN